MQVDEIPQLPIFSNDEITNNEIDFEELKTAKNRFFVYETEKGEMRVKFDKLDGYFYSSIAHNFSKPFYHKIYEFLKLALEGVRLIKKENKKGAEMSLRIERHLEKWS